jgi:hypothetical protein
MMSRFLILTAFSLTLCLLMGQADSAQATSGLMSDWQNYYQTCEPLNTASCTACHQNGFDFNTYGEDLRVRIEDLGMTGTEAFIDAESADSDGDGFTNGQEIVVDCTFPWDETSQGTVAVQGATWDRIKALYR